MLGNALMYELKALREYLCLLGNGIPCVSPPIKPIIDLSSSPNISPAANEL